MPTPRPNATPPPTKPPYPIPRHTLRALVLGLPRPPADAPDAAWQQVVQDGLDKLAACDPRDAIETMLAIDLIVLNAGMLDALHLAFEPAATPDQARHHRASAIKLHRAVAGTARLLDHQRHRPAAPERDWGDAPATLTTAWRAVPSRPPQPVRGGTTADTHPEVVVRSVDEIDDAELASAIEQEHRAKAGEPKLPRKPGEPMVLYRYKPQDYVHQFSPDPKNFRKYSGWENKTMAERREFFGYGYAGPLGPAEALTRAPHGAMPPRIAAEDALTAEYGK